MIKIIYFFDIYIGSGFFYGCINLEIGLNICLEDFIFSLKFCIDKVIFELVDLVLFGGDVFLDVIFVLYIK